MISFIILFSHPLVSIHGIPGAIDYFLLFLVKQGNFDSIEQKRISMILNTWFRNPYTLLASGYSLVSLIKYQRYECLPCVIMMMYNGIYYNQSTTISYMNSLNKHS